METNIKNTSDLKAAIASLTIQQATDLLLLKKEFAVTKEKLTVSNLIKSGFKEVASTPKISTNLFKAILGLTTGFVTKKLLIGKTINPIKKLLGAAMEMFVANKVVNNADTLKSVGSALLNKILPKKEEKAVV